MSPGEGFEIKTLATLPVFSLYSVCVVKDVSYQLPVLDTRPASCIHASPPWLTLTPLEQ